MTNLIQTTGGYALQTIRTDDPKLVLLPHGLTDDLLDDIILAVLDNVDRDDGGIDVPVLRADLEKAFRLALEAQP